MHLELFNLLIWKRFKKMTSDSVWEKARKNWDKVHCSCAGDRRGLRHCPAWIMARSCQPSREAQGQQVICADSSEQAVAGVSAPCLQEERGWKERRGSTKGRHAPAASQTKMRKQNGMLNEVCLPQIPCSVELTPSAAMFEGQGRVCRNIECNASIPTAS